MKALVTGASGFIGSTLIEELGTLGFDVLALMRKSSSAANLEGMKYQRVEGDLSDFESLRRAVREVDYVFHLAGALTARHPGEYTHHNVEGTRRLAQACAEVRPNLSRFVFVSSLAAGGPVNSLEPRTELQKDEPVSAYGRSKLAAEQALLEFKSKFPISIIRPPMVYGPKDKATFTFVQMVARNLMPLLRGDTETGHKYYSLVHVRDLCRGIVQAGLARVDKVPSGEVFYLTGDGTATYEDVLATIADKLNRDPLRLPVPKAVLKAAAYVSTGFGKVLNRTFQLSVDKLDELLPDYWLCSNEKAKRMLGFSPEYDLPKGWGNAIEWYQRQRWI